MGKKIQQFLLNNQSWLGFVALLIFCYLLLFLRLGFYPLIDVDETRYVGISADLLKQSDWITMILNGSPFLEKPPLYFWLNAMFFNVTGIINPYTGRFMTAVLAMFAVLFTYFFGRKTINEKFGLVSSFVLLSNLWFLLFSHIAILDMGYMVFTMSAIYSAVLATFCKEKSNEKYCWYLGWLFMGLAVLMKGLIGFIVPSMVVFLYFLSVKRVKDLFKPINLIPGLIIFVLAVTPWHYSIFTQYNMEWVNEYIIKHHFARFINSEGLGRKQAFWFYIPVILLGFIPWIFNTIASFVSGIKTMVEELKATKNIMALFNAENKERATVLFASIYFVSVFMFFSVSSTKLPSYILTVFPALSLITGYYWYKYLVDDKHSKGIKISTIVGAVFFILLGVVGYVLVNFVTIPSINKEIMLAQNFSSQLIMWITLMPIISLLCLKNKNKILLFTTKLVFMFGIMLLSTTYIFSYITYFGQSELESYAQDANLLYNSKLVTFDFANKYSIMNFYGKNVNFIPDQDYDALDEIIKDAKKSKAPIFVIVKNKNFANYEERFEDWQIINKGIKYSLLGKFYTEHDKNYFPKK